LSCTELGNQRCCVIVLRLTGGVVSVPAFYLWDPRRSTVQHDRHRATHGRATRRIKRPLALRCRFPPGPFYHHCFWLGGGPGGGSARMGRRWRWRLSLLRGRPESGPALSEARGAVGQAPPPHVTCDLRSSHDHTAPGQRPALPGPRCSRPAPVCACFCCHAV
jgi:hypothetical protein